MTRIQLLACTAMVFGIYQPIDVFAQAASASEAAAGQDAQDGQASGGLADIVVTANRRAENMQNVGISVTAVSAEELKSRGIADLRDITKIAPGVVFEPTVSGSANAQLTIRGVSQTDFSANQESPNSLYIDEVYNSAIGTFAFPLFDVERVEVLRGPQGTLFGRASSGGLMSVYTAGPGKDFSGYAEAGYGSFNNAYVEAAAGGPLSDTVRFRIAGRGERHDGWYRNDEPGQHDSFERKFFGVRGQLEADLSSNLTARLSVAFQKTPSQREGTYTPVPTYIGPSGAPEILPADLDAYGTGPGVDPLGYRNTSGTRAGRFNDFGRFGVRSVTPTLYLTWGSGDVTVNSITNYTNVRGHYLEDSDATPLNIAAYSSRTDLEQFSEELRANGKSGRLSWTAGFYFLRNVQKNVQMYELPGFSGTPLGFSSRNAVDQRTTSLAGFAQLEYELTDKLKLTAGARLTWERKTLDSKLYFLELGEDVFSPPELVYDYSRATVGRLAANRDTLPSGKLQLDYKPSRDALFYVSASRGIKTAGYNNNLTMSVDETNTLYRSEYLYSYEAGSKLELFDNHVRLNSAVFYNDYHRFQGYAYVNQVGRIGNYDGRFIGFESELNVALPDRLSLAIGGNYVDSKLKDVPTVYNGPSTTQQAAQAPHVTLNGSVSKILTVGEGDLSLNWNFSYLSQRYISIDNYSGSRLPGKFEHSLRISYDLQDRGLQLSFWINNISNVAKPIAVADQTNATGSFLYSYNRPRWIGGSIRKTF